METPYKDTIFTIGKFTKEYKSETKSKLTDYQINQFLKNVFDELVDEMILNSYTIEVGRMFNVTFKRFERNFDKLAINWGTSNKLKKQLLSEGKKLANKIGTSASGNPIFDDGAMWMVWFTDPYYVSSSYSPKKHLNNKGEYESFNLRRMWDIEQHTKLIARFTHYEKQNKVTKIDIPLHYGSKDNIL